MVTATPHEDVEAAYGQPPDIVAQIIASVLDYGRACADELPDSQQMWLDDIRERLEGLQWEAYDDGRKDLAEESAWRSVESAPEDEHILIATSGGHVGTAFWTDEGDGKVWAWGHPQKDHGQYVHQNLTPIGWMPLPKPPEEK